MVSDLLQTVTGELEKSNANQHHDIMQRSPSPEKRRPSPRRQQSRDMPAAGVPSFKLPAGRSSVSSGSSHTTLADQGARNVIDLSSDYGDEDFDDDTLMELDATLGAVQDTKPCPAPEPAPLETPKRAPPDANGFDDEFGDMDDDLFEAAEDLIT
jgi:DNA replication ATP-dependent helicase Dna2